ncbi:MAG: TRAP transporter substrate-binding protein [Bradyrhizobiaceae bacterium]|nr:TRAP transporter substrate-binding protein [Bradyrhizobiaceae bacterium]
MQTGIRHVLAAAAVVLGSVTAISATDAQTLQLKLSHGFPSVHGLQVEFVNPWIEELQKRTGGRVKVVIYPAGSSFGALDRQLDQVKSGVVDLAMGLSVVPRDRMPRTGLWDLPFVAPDRVVGNKALWSLAQTDMAKDYEGLKLLGLLVDCSVLHTVSKSVRTLDDIRGLRIRVPSNAGGELVRAAGGVPVAMPQGEVYENLERNVIDGAITPWDVLNTLKLGEVVKYHVDNYLFCGQLWFAMNKGQYDSLPPDIRKTVDEISGDALIGNLDAIYARWTKAGKAIARKGGSTVTRLSDADIAKWKELAKPAIEKYLTETAARGVPDIRQIFDNVNAAVKKYSAKP